jgi:anti-anti-sigma factor
MTGGIVPQVEQQDEHGARLIQIKEPKLGWDIDVQQLKAALLKAAAGATRAAVDMSEVRYLASPTIGALLSFNRDAAEAGCKVVFFGLHQYVHDTIHTLGLDPVLVNCRTKGEAIDRLNESAD